MSSASPNRFLQAHDRPRVAVFTSAQFPAKHELTLLERILQLGREQDLVLRFFHSSVPDELPDTADTCSLLARSMTAPVNDKWNDADRAWFERRDPEVVERLLAVIAAHTDRPVAEIRCHPALAAAFSMARLAHAWGADLLVSQGHFEAASAASISRALLAKPRVHVVHDQPGDALLPRLWPWNATQSDLLIHSNDSQRLAEDASPQTDICALESEDVDRKIADLLSRDRRARTPHRPTRSFCTARAPQTPAAAEARPFLVLGAERTGSNMLVGMLESHEQVKSYGELFNPRLIGDDVIDGELPVAAAPSDLLPMRKRDPGAFHRELIRLAAAEGARAVGFKLLYYHGCINDALVDHLASTPDLRVVHLRRRDRLGRWVSHERASQSDSWFAVRGSGSDRPRPVTVTLPLGAMLNDFLLQEQQEERADATFGHLPLMQVCYEDLTAAPQRVADEVLAFLGVPPRDLEIRSRKTGTADPRQLVENWGELKSSLQRTPWRAIVEAE